MRSLEWDRLALRGLAAMPFLDRLDLAAVTGMSEGTAHNALGRLRREGLADSTRHAAPLTPSTRRWYPTAEGVRRLALEDGPAWNGCSAPFRSPPDGSASCWRGWTPWP